MRIFLSCIVLACCTAVAVVAAAAPVEAPVEAPAATRALARDIFAHIVAIDSSAGTGGVPKVAAYLAAQFRDGGFPEADIHTVPLGDTASLVVRYRGDGSAGRPIDFMAHMDVIPARRADWLRDPFQLVEEDGYFFGRGTWDIKQEVALLSATFLRLKAEGYVPGRDLILVFSGDEETAQRTVADLADAHRELVDAEFALNGDGGNGVLSEDTGEPIIHYVQGAEKSSAAFILTTHNPGGHSSQPRADNAIYELADALKALQAYQFPVSWNDWTLGDFREAGSVTPGALGAAMRRFAANPRDKAAADALTANPAYVGRVRTTCVATMLEGGHAENALPQSASATVNCRIFPGTSMAEVQAVLQRLVGPKVDVRPAYEALVSPPSPVRADVMAAVAAAVAAANPGARVVPTQASYATDGSVFRNAGIPTYGVEATFTKNSDEFAHGLNERIRVSSFYAGLTYWYTMVKTLAAPAAR